MGVHFTQRVWTPSSSNTHAPPFELLCVCVCVCVWTDRVEEVEWRESTQTLWRYPFYTPILPIIASGYPVYAPLVHATRRPSWRGTWTPSQGYMASQVQNCLVGRVYSTKPDRFLLPHITPPALPTIPLSLPCGVGSAR